MSLIIKKEAQGVVFAPSMEDSDPSGCLYPRVIELQHAGQENGTLLATFEMRPKDEPVFPIYRSTDHGLTWKPYSTVPDMKNHWGNKYQPHLFELPCALGDLPEGTVMLAGNSIPNDRTVTDLVLYISQDHGKTWQYRSSIVQGGFADVDKRDCDVRPVWEPYLYIDKYGDLVCYYSDERFLSDGYNQLLAYQVSKDGGKTWGEEIYNVAIPDGKMRPGMPIVVKLPNGKYFMCYEMVGLPRFDVFFKISDDGLDWGDPADFGTPIHTKDGKFLGSTPYCLWVPQGGPNGTILVSGKREGEGDFLREPGWFHANYNNGEGPWERVPMPVHMDARIGYVGYSMGMCLIENDTKLIQLAPVQQNPEYGMIAYGIASLETE